MILRKLSRFVSRNDRPINHDSYTCFQGKWTACRRRLPTAGPNLFRNDLRLKTCRGKLPKNDRFTGGPMKNRCLVLSTILGDLNRPTKAALEKAMEGHVLSRAELIGTYQR
jgi:hypothetical protein